MFAVLAAVMCCVYLVAFAGVPLVLSVMTDGKRDKEAFEIALRNANVCGRLLCAHSPHHMMAVPAHTGQAWG